MATTSDSDIGFDRVDLSGQVTLPGFDALIACEVQALAKPEHELFCVRFVETGDSAKAYQLAINPECTDRLAAQKNAHKLVKRGEIRRRIAEIAAVYRNRAINEVLAFNLNALRFDPSKLFDATGKMIKLKDLPAGTGVEAKIVDGSLHYLPVFPSPEKARDSLAKIMGMEKQMLELTGKDGGPVAVDVTQMSPIQKAARISHLLKVAQQRAKEKSSEQ